MLRDSPASVNLTTAALAGPLAGATPIRVFELLAWLFWGFNLALPGAWLALLAYARNHDLSDREDELAVFALFAGAFLATTVLAFAMALLTWLGTEGFGPPAKVALGALGLFFAAGVVFLLVSLWAPAFVARAVLLVAMPGPILWLAAMVWTPIALVRFRLRNRTRHHHDAG